MLIRLAQLLLAFAGGSFAIYTGLEGGYAIGFVAIATAYLGTLAGVRIVDACSRAKQRRGGIADNPHE